MALVARRSSKQLRLESALRRNMACDVLSHILALGGQDYGIADVADSTKVFRDIETLGDDESAESDDEIHPDTEDGAERIIGAAEDWERWSWFTSSRACGGERS
jgi:hypothetical protein